MERERIMKKESGPERERESIAGRVTETDVKFIIIKSVVCV